MYYKNHKHEHDTIELHLSETCLKFDLHCGSLVCRKTRRITDINTHIYTANKIRQAEDGVSKLHI